ncbi:MAG: Cys-tRNA(Pro) deacylase [Coriobacteriaceae bacterium]|nr:Cys-tRNA(Pro) deacylase [Coriobacteriaceae bacterium]
MAKAPKIQKTNAMRELERAGVAFAVHTYEDDGEHARGLGEAIAAQLGEDPGQGFKTLVTVASTGEHVVCCVPVAEELDFKAAAKATGQKSLAMLPAKDLTAVTGYVRGGCSPVGMKKRFPVVIDETCQLYDRMFISGGRCGVQLELSPDDLIAFTGAVVAPIVREE